MPTPLPATPELTALAPAALAGLMPARNGRPSLAHGRAVWRWLRADGLPGGWPESLPEAGHKALVQLRKQVSLPDVTIDEEVVSRDGTTKWRLSCRGMPVETVLIPAAGRSTVCVSSQSGCTRWCDFCSTARMPFEGQLTTGEIVAQVLHARARAPREAPLTNVVFMGMGEPLDNWEQVAPAIDVLDAGLQLSPRHVTISTSGVLPRMKDLFTSTRACIALSLHATTQELRDRLMPRVARWPITELCAFMREASAADPSRHFFIEYVLLAGVNDSLADAERLVELLRGVRARVNLIPFNAGPGAPFQRPGAGAIKAFHARVVSGGVLCLTRETRGDDTAAACGQLVVLRRPAAAIPATRS